MKDEFRKDEIILAVNDMKRIETVSGDMALAANIRALMFKEKFTNPNDPNMGIGIQGYLFNYIDDELKSTMGGEIKSQINTYITDENILEVKIRTYEELSPQEKRSNMNENLFTDSALFISIVIEPEEGVEDDYSNLRILNFNFDVDENNNIISDVYI